MSYCIVLDIFVRLSQFLYIGVERDASTKTISVQLNPISEHDRLLNFVKNGIFLKMLLKTRCVDVSMCQDGDAFLFSVLNLRKFQ